MIHVVRRFLPLVLGPLGGLLGSLLGFALHQLLTRSLQILWAPYLGWQWLVGLLAYPLLGFVLALPFLAVYPGPRNPYRSEFGRAQDAHLKIWIAVLFTMYVPVGVAFAYTRWWNAPSFSIPFTDSYVYAGGRGDLLTAVIAVMVLAPFCGAGVERLTRGVPRVLRLLFGPPLATLLAMASAAAVSVSVGGLLAAPPVPDPFGPLLQPFNQSGWDSNLLLSFHTVVAGAIAGTLAMLTVALPLTQGLVDVQVREARRRWALPMVAVALSGVLVVLALGQGHGTDTLRCVHLDIEPGYQDLVGNLVAPADSDVLRMRTERDGFYLLEFPSADLRGRHQVVVPGIPIPTPDASMMRYLVEGAIGYDVQEIQVMGAWPQRTGVSSYSGTVRFEYAGAPESVYNRAVLEGPVDGLRQFKGDVRRGPLELTLRSSQPTYWTLFAPRTADGLGWWWEQGWSVVTVSAYIDGELLFKRIVDQEGYGVNHLTVLLAGAHPDAPPPDLTLKIHASRTPQGEMWIPVEAEGLSPGDAIVHSTYGPTFLGVSSDDEFTIHLTPGGALAEVVVLGLDGPADELTVMRRHDDGLVQPASDSLMLTGSTHLSVEGAAPERRAVLALSGQGGARSWLIEK